MPAALYRRWWAGAVLSGSLVALGTAALCAAWQPARGLRWGLLVSLALIYVFGYLWRFLARNRRADDGKVLPQLGIGNLLTLVRGVLAALLAGFLFASRPSGTLAWAPALLLLSIGVFDFADGYLARVYGGVTLLGAKLDVTYDALAMLVATALAVQYGQVPAPYLVLGLAYYLFHFHAALRRRWGQQVHLLPPSAHRRFFGGCFHGFLVVILAPVFTPPGTVLAGVLFGLPVAASYARDWLVAVGRLDSTSARYRRWRARLRTALFSALPIAIRGVTVMAGLALLVQGIGAPAPWPSLLAARGALPPLLPALSLGAVAVLAVGSVGLGWMGRVGALGLLAVACADLLLRGFGLLNAAVIAGSIAVLLLGTGAFSRWRPEDEILLRRAGAPRPSASRS